MILKKALKIFRWMVLAFCILSLWGWIVHLSFQGNDKLGKFGKSVQWIAKFPRMVQEAFRQDLGTKNPLYLENIFPDITSFEEVLIENDTQYLLVTRFSESQNQPTTKLVHLATKKVVSEWVLDYDKLFGQLNEDDIKILNDLGRLRSDKKGFDKFTIVPQHAFLNKDFSIIFNLTRGPVVCLDSLSNVKWFLGGDFHHTVERDHEGNFWIPRVDYESEYAEDLRLRDDVLCKISPEGEVLYTKSIIDIFVENGYRAHIFGGWIHDDPVHLNDIQPVLTDTKYWKKGDLFVSIRTGSIVFLYRPSKNKIIWLKQGPWLNQHDVDILDSTRISVFGNDIVRRSGSNEGFPNDHFSKSNDIYVYDFATDAITTPYSKAFRSLKIKTPTQGLANILPNGTIYVEETDYGRHAMMDSVSAIWQFVDQNSRGEILFSAWSRLLIMDDNGLVRDW